MNIKKRKYDPSSEYFMQQKQKNSSSEKSIFRKIKKIQKSINSLQSLEISKCNNQTKTFSKF